jgi:hypothetical protein
MRRPPGDHAGSRARGICLPPTAFGVAGVTNTLQTGRRQLLYAIRLPSGDHDGVLVSTSGGHGTRAGGAPVAVAETMPTVQPAAYAIRFPSGDQARRAGGARNRVTRPPPGATSATDTSSE